MSIETLRNYWERLKLYRQEPASLEAYIIYRYRPRVSSSRRLGMKIKDGKLVPHHYNRPSDNYPKHEHE